LERQLATTKTQLQSNKYLKTKLNESYQQISKQLANKEQDLSMTVVQPFHSNAITESSKNAIRRSETKSSDMKQNLEMKKQKLFSNYYKMYSIQR
jgi:hypothetical protein